MIYYIIISIVRLKTKDLNFIDTKNTISDSSKRSGSKRSDYMRKLCGLCHDRGDRVFKLNKYSRGLFFSMWCVKCNYKKYEYTNSIDDVLTENEFGSNMYHSLEGRIYGFYREC